VGRGILWGKKIAVVFRQSVSRQALACRNATAYHSRAGGKEAARKATKHRGGGGRQTAKVRKNTNAAPAYRAERHTPEAAAGLRGNNVMYIPIREEQRELREGVMERRRTNFYLT